MIKKKRKKYAELESAGDRPDIDYEGQIWYYPNKEFICLPQ